ncbi:MAG: hypothetical protein CMJ65_18500 [Planctomycetaceae bacterium]|nr:hypothetical protein [Planctomycetaceae bacterium]
MRTLNQDEASMSDDPADGPGKSTPLVLARPRRIRRPIIMTVLTVIVLPTVVIVLLEILPEDVGGLVECRGTVRFNGQPLTMGTVTIRNDNAKDDDLNSTGPINEDGWFTLSTEGKPGAPVGRYRAMVVLPQGAPGPNLPKPYRSLETTPLSVDIQPESRFNVFTLELTDRQQ